MASPAGSRFGVAGSACNRWLMATMRAFEEKQKLVVQTEGTPKGVRKCWTLATPFGVPQSVPPRRRDKLGGSPVPIADRCQILQKKTNVSVDLALSRSTC